MSEKVFVYGTLRKGHGNHKVIEQFVKTIEPATIRAWMFDLGPYPTIVTGDGYVEGEIVEFHDVAGAFQAMDWLEGFTSPDHPSNLYERVVTMATLKSGLQEECYVYMFPDERKQELLQQHPLILHGDWAKRTEQSHLLYFAYGSCMNQASFAKDVPEHWVIGKAEVSNHRVAFTRKSIKWGAGVADIIEEFNNTAEGVLYLIPTSLLGRLDAREGASSDLRYAAYQRKEIIVSLNGLEVPALTYEVVHKEAQEIAPSAEYVQTIMDGTTLLSREYVQRLEQHIQSLTIKN